MLFCSKLCSQWSNNHLGNNCCGKYLEMKVKRNLPRRISEPVSNFELVFLKSPPQSESTKQIIALLKGTPDDQLLEKLCSIQEVPKLKVCSGIHFTLSNHHRMTFTIGSTSWTSSTQYLLLGPPPTTFLAALYPFINQEKYNYGCLFFSPLFSTASSSWKFCALPRWLWTAARAKTWVTTIQWRFIRVFGFSEPSSICLPSLHATNCPSLLELWKFSAHSYGLRLHFSHPPLSPLPFLLVQNQWIHCDLLQLNLFKAPPPHGKWKRQDIATPVLISRPRKRSSAPISL